jgi:hypothetical protein
MVLPSSVVQGGRDGDDSGRNGGRTAEGTLGLRRIWRSIGGQVLDEGWIPARVAGHRRPRDRIGDAYRIYSSNVACRGSDRIGGVGGQRCDFQCSTTND